jgi:hypothetical protein
MSNELLYQHAKQTENECKQVGAYAWSQAMASIGQLVQYANAEFTNTKNKPHQLRVRPMMLTLHEQKSTRKKVMWHCTRQESNQRNSEKWNENYRLLKR